MKALAVVGVIIVIVLVIAIVVTVIQTGTTKTRLRTQRTGLWKLVEESGDESVAVYAVEPGTGRKLLVGPPADFDAPDFDMQLELLRSEGRQKIVTLNDGRKR